MSSACVLPLYSKALTRALRNPIEPRLQSVHLGYELVQVGSALLNSFESLDIVAVARIMLKVLQDGE